MTIHYTAKIECSECHTTLSLETFSLIPGLARLEMLGKAGLSDWKHIRGFDFCPECAEKEKDR
jgi:hypothetical protein